MLTQWAITLIALSPGLFESAETPIGRVEAYGAILVCDEPVHDFGAVWKEQWLFHEFKVRNEGTEPAWMRVFYAFAGTMSRCEIAIQPGETIGVPYSLDSRKLRNRFEKSATLRLITPPDDQTCGRCGWLYWSEEHLQHCGPSCFVRRESPWCVHHSLEASCDAF